MKISVLIAANHSGALLAGALAGVRAQIHPDWEIIVADHGPPDESEKIVRDFAASTSQPVHYTRLDQAIGVAAARNRLLALATGNPVAFLEPVDTWTSRHLANTTQHFAAGADIVLSDVRLTEGNVPRAPAEIAIPSAMLANTVRTLFARDTIPTISCVAFRRELAERAGPFDEHFRAGEGRDFWLRCALARARFAATRRATCQCPPARPPTPARAALVAEHAVLFYEKHRDLAAVPAALRRRLLAASLVAHGRLLRSSDPARAARCFLRAWSLQPVHVQTLGQFALTGWRSAPAPGPESRRSNTVGNETHP